MITVIAKPQSCVSIKGTETVGGSAYRLVHDSLSSVYTGNIYIRAYDDTLLNLSTPGVRNTMPEDRYVEVDLDIIVKEKS